VTASSSNPGILAHFTRHSSRNQNDIRFKRDLVLFATSATTSAAAAAAHSSNIMPPSWPTHFAAATSM